MQKCTSLKVYFILTDRVDRMGHWVCYKGNWNDGFEIYC